MQLLHARAQESFPDLDNDSALVKYIRENRIESVFFLDEEGHRCIFGPGKARISQTLRFIGHRRTLSRERSNGRSPFGKRPPALKSFNLLSFRDLVAKHLTSFNTDYHARY